MRNGVLISVIALGLFAASDARGQYFYPRGGAFGYYRSYSTFGGSNALPGSAMSRNAFYSGSPYFGASSRQFAGSAGGRTPANVTWYSVNGGYTSAPQTGLPWRERGPREGTSRFETRFESKLDSVEPALARSSSRNSTRSSARVAPRETYVRGARTLNRPNLDGRLGGKEELMPVSSRTFEPTKAKAEPAPTKPKADGK